MLHVRQEVVAEPSGGRARTVLPRISPFRYAMPTKVLYRIRVQGHLDRSWSQWFEGLTITHEPSGETVMAGPVRDQAALFGVLMKIRDLGLSLVSVNRVESEPARSHMGN
jgi:hypothetical protein